MASEAQICAIGILANRPNAQVMVLSFLRRQESRVLGVPGFRIKCGMTAQKVPTKSCAFMQNKANFQKSQMNVSIFPQEAYENKSNWTLGENKPNSNPIKANLHLTAENAEYAEKKDIFVSDCPIEKYALYPISPCSLRTWRLMKNKANSKPNKANFRKNECKLLPSRHPGSIIEFRDSTETWMLYRKLYVRRFYNEGCED